MERNRLARLGLAVSLVAVLASPAAAFDIDRETVTVRSIDLPTVPVDGIDFGTLRAEVAMGAVDIGEPTLRKTKTICKPKGSKNPLKDAVEIETHYYQVPYRVASGVVVVRDGDGKVVLAGSIDALESYERFGYDRCRYWFPDSLESDFEEQRAAFQERVRAGVGEYAVDRATAIVDDALFVKILDRKVPLYTFQDKKRDYSDLDEAAGLARAAYEATNRVGAEAETEAGLTAASALWAKALEESDPADKKARINRKVTSRIHESLGVAQLVLGDTASAIMHLEKASMIGGVATSRSNGTGTRDLLDRARAADDRRRANPSGDEHDVDLEPLFRTADAHHGRIPVQWSPASALSALRAEHVAFVSDTNMERFEADRDRQEAAVASGEVNRFERRVQHTSMQGFILFLMPFPEKFEQFPVEVCELTHLNQLRAPNHGFDTVPDTIGSLEHLKVLDLSGNAIRELPRSIGSLQNLEKLDLSGNRLETVPDEIGQLSGLKVLKVKGNPLAPGEVDRLRELLPGCKIKS